MAGHAMEEDRLAIGIGQQVGGFEHLLDRRLRPVHRHEEPVNSRLGHDFRLADILGIVAIDRR